MTKQAVVRFDRRYIELSKDGNTPLSVDELYSVRKALEYYRIKPIFGYAARLQYGNRKIQKELCAMYTYDSVGRFICASGWRFKIIELLKQDGFSVKVIDDRAPLSRPNCYIPNWQNITQHFTLRPRQDECIASIASAIPEHGGIVDAVPAIGKTAIITMLCLAYPNAKIDVVTCGLDIIDTIYKSLLRYTPDVGCVGGGKKSKHRVTVFSADSLHRSDFDADIVLVDELHKLLTERHITQLLRYDHALRFGFSATPDTRIDQNHRWIEGLYGPVLFQITWSEAVDAGLIVPIRVYWYDVPKSVYNIDDYEDIVDKKRYGIWRNEERNRIIAEVAKSYLSKNLQTLILVETVEHALLLKQLLPEFEVCYSEAALRDVRRKYKLNRRGLLNGVPEMSRQRRKLLREQFEKGELRGCIANTVWTTGVSFNSLQVLIRADGGESETNNQQWPGRVARIDPAINKSYGILVDFTDVFHPYFAERARYRRRSYASNDWQQILPDGTLYIKES